MVCYFVLLLIIGRIYAKPQLKHDKIYIVWNIISMAVFIVLMTVFYSNGFVNIAISVLYVASVYLQLLLYRKRNKCD